ncbi:hypothetical protein OU995_07870 [Roseateles sp. SL47]|uniref:hypothetical protein n=1 Tax=Roseateles sp. SL47 TaxID=2995138 RepID=UPI002270FE8D|nr:hypothetical protein [Roseateles sp. SL47]WAC74611.1 hypothetical protein OU995_07870 [Roseateles sp. SL47]
MPSITWMPDPEWRLASPRGWRERLSKVLLTAGGRLIRWAWHLAPASHREPPDSALEYCPIEGHSGRDGALYVNGQLVGTLAGVRRL